MTILWRIEQLLNKDLETNNETTTVAVQRRGKHASAAIDLLLETVFYMWSVPRSYLENNLGEPVRQNRVLRAIGNFDRRILVGDLHLAFKIPYLYDYITKLCRRQAEVILNHENPNVRAIGQGEARHRKHKRLKLGGGQAYDRSIV
jgi:hypothetical protein